MTQLTSLFASSACSTQEADVDTSAACTGNQVKVEMSAAPVTMQDLLFINGKSLVSNCGKNLVSSKPGVAGLVGLGKVTEVGENVKHLRASDTVVVSQTGTWTKKGKPSTLNFNDIDTIFRALFPSYHRWSNNSLNNQ